MLNEIESQSTAERTKEKCNFVIQFSFSYILVIVIILINIGIGITEANANVFLYFSHVHKEKISTLFLWFKSHYFLWTDTFLWSTTTELWCDVIWCIFFFIISLTFLIIIVSIISCNFFVFSFVVILKKEGKYFLSANFWVKFLPQNQLFTDLWFEI